MNFISRFGGTVDNVTVENSKETSTITCCTSDDYSVGGIRMKQAVSKEWNYFEVTLTATDEDGAIAIGIGHEKYPLCNMPGWGAGSIGYHSDDGGLFHGACIPKLCVPTCTTGDRMGCGVDFTQSENGHVRVWFTKNDEVVIKPQVVELRVRLAPNFYPLICMKNPGQKAQYMGHWQKAPPTDDDSKPTVCLLTGEVFLGIYVLCVCVYYASVGVISPYSTYIYIPGLCEHTVCTIIKIIR